MADSIICGYPLPCTMSDHGNGNIRVTFARIDKINAQRFGAVGMYVADTTQTQVAEILSVPATVPTDDSYYYEIDVSFPDANWADTDRCSPQTTVTLESYTTIALLKTGAPTDGKEIIFWASNTNNLEDWSELLGRIANMWSCFGMTPRCGITMNNSAEWYRPGGTLDNNMTFDNMTMIKNPGVSGAIDLHSTTKGTADTITLSRLAILSPSVSPGSALRFYNVGAGISVIVSSCIITGSANTIAVTGSGYTVLLTGCTIINGVHRAVDGASITTARNCYLHGVAASSRNISSFDHCATSDAQGDIVALRNTKLETLLYPRQTVSVGTHFDLPTESVLAGQGTYDALSAVDGRGETRPNPAPTIGFNEGVDIGIESSGGGGAFGMMGMVG